MKIKTPANAPDLFHRTREEWLDECRETARDLLKLHATLTVEDVLRVCPKPKYLHRNVIGCIFKHQDFKSVGFTVARKPSSNGRAIRLWRLK